jgi:hypothetical protein
MTSGFNTRPSAAEPTAGTGPLPLMLRIGAILALGAVLGATPVNADQAADTLKRLNLLGRWANDCANPTRTGISYEIDAEGSAFFVNVVGSHRILSATSSDGREVVLTIKFLKPTEEVRINAFRMISANTYVPTMNRNERNEYTVRNGILLSTGRKMPPLHRCDGQGTS